MSEWKKFPLPSLSHKWIWVTDFSIIWPSRANWNISSAPGLRWMEFNTSPPEIPKYPLHECNRGDYRCWETYEGYLRLGYEDTGWQEVKFCPFCGLQGKNP